ncbi:MarR family winged helix-turn-helix transcriptional regulator [Phytohalomonas tamaricis]|uniref:MarR family winged helix-turn-helix transcriptional regulator n=1 Tax=Phytohalomonas tamaricis TaxID=2081032 RepID=UPI001319C36E|nr:MarR family winged helix-turn-helix transcriptional regulator [Phytohalomonas tamaricis]
MNQTHIFGESLFRLLHAYKRALRENFTAVGIELTVSHIRVLKRIAGMPQCTAQAVAAGMQIDKGRIARLMKELETEHLIEKRHHPEDSRSRQITLTHQGRTLIERINTVEAETSEYMVAGIDKEQLMTCAHIINDMVKNLET